MDHRTRRPASPGSRRISQGGHSSTGTLIYPSAFDQFQGPSRSSIGISSGPRTSAERIIAPRITPRYRPESPPRQSSRDDYAVRPRRLTLDPHDAIGRRPLSVITPSSPGRARPVINSAIDKPSSPMVSKPPRDESYYIQPASSSRRDHRRNYTADAIDISRMATGDRGARDWTEPGTYRRSGGGRNGYIMNPPLIRSQDMDDRSSGYEYTDRREQMYRDTAPRPRPRRGSNAGVRERPISMTELEDYLPRINQSNRDVGPPIAMNTRGFGGVGRSGSLRHGQRGREDDPAPRDYAREDYDPKSRRGPRPTVFLHQESGDKYSNHGKDPNEIIDARIRRHRAPSVGSDQVEPRRANLHEIQPNRAGNDRSPRYRDHRDHDDKDRDRRAKEDVSKPKREEISTNGLVASAAGAAAAGVAEGARRQHRHERSRDDATEDFPKEPVKADERNPISSGQDVMENTSISTDAKDEEKRERHERRRLRRKNRIDKDTDSTRKNPEDWVPPAENVNREPGSQEKPEQHQAPNVGEAQRSSHHSRRHHSRTRDEDSYSDDSSTSEDRDPRHRQVRVVTPSEDPREPEPPIKGILRQPREKFPEDPAPVREGVAPLKDAGKKGIPPNARWTKIDRKLVNPEALEEGNERYEERPDYVIVLRVLTKEDIEAYALKTQEIRGKRGLLTMGQDSQ